MTLQEKLAALEEIMELDDGTLTPEMSLDEVDEWDSMAALSFVVLMQDEFKKNMTGQQIREFQTVQDILDVMAE